MTDFLLQFIPTLEHLSIPGAIVIVLVVLWRSKVLEALALKIQNINEGLQNQYNQVNTTTNSKGINNNKERIDSLEKFQFEMETNHNTDLAKLIVWKELTEPRLVKIEEKLDKVSEDTSFIRGKLTAKE